MRQVCDTPSAFKIAIAAPRNATVANGLQRYSSDFFATCTAHQSPIEKIDATTRKTTTVLVMDSLLPATTDERGMRRIRPNQYQVWIL
jgi:hypothetical protein